MQVDQREALEDPRPLVGIMAHAYANPLLINKRAPGAGTGTAAAGDTNTAAAGGSGAAELDASTAAAAAAANELVIDALLAAEAETIGPEVRFIGLPRGTAAFPARKPSGGAWRGADGLRVVDSALPKGLVKRGWLHKHTRELPGSLVYLASVDVSAGAEDWAGTEDEIVGDLRSVVANLAARDVKVLLVLVRAGAEAGQGGGREERDVADERALSLRRRAEIDARMVLMIGEPDLASHSNPPSVRRIAKAAKDLAVAHYASHISRLRRWEKVLVPTQRLYRPLLTRLYFKLGVLHEMQGLVDRSLLCYQEVSALLSDMVPRDGGRFQGGRGDADRGTLGGAFLRGGADPMEQIRGVAEVVHLRLVRNHLHRNMSVEGAIRQLRRHVSAFGRPGDAAAAAAAAAASSRAGKGSPSSTSSAGGGGGEAAGQPGGGGEGGGPGSGSGVVPYRHHAWLSRQYLVFGEMLGAHMSQIAQSSARGGVWAGGGALGYTSPGHYYLGAALQAVRRRKTADRLLRGIDKDKVLASLEGLEVREPLYLGESVRLVDPTDAERNLRQECRGFLDLEESKTDRVEMARSLLVKALEHCPSGEDGFRRRRVLILGHLGEESFVAGRYDDALERLPPVWQTYLADGWLKLATAALRRVYVCAWRSGKARTVANMALHLSSKALRPWVPLEESKRLLGEALPLVGALEAPSEAAQSDQGFVASVPPEGPASERLEVSVDASRLLLRLSGRFSAAEASAGDGLTLRVALMSLLPLDIRLEAVELTFNHSALNCTIRDTQSTGPAAATPPAAESNNPPSSSSSPDHHQQQHTADLSLRAGGLLTANVGLCLPWSALPSSEPLRLVEARVLLTKRGGGATAAATAAAAAASGVTLLVPSGPGSDIAREGGEGGAWGRVPGFETVRLVPPRARAHVRIAEPSSVLLGLTTRLLVTVSKAPVATPGAGATATSFERSGGGSGCCGKPPNPFRGGFLHLECEPAPVPPPIVSPHSATTVGGGSSQEQHQQPSPAAPPPARPRPERAFFWAPTTTAAAAAQAGGEGPSVAVSDGKGDFLPVVVGSDGQPLEGIPLPLSSLDPSRDQEEEENQEVTVPVWVRSETAGKVAVRARVVYGLGGKLPGGAGAAAAAGGGGEAEAGVAVTEWARAEVLCVRPLAMVVDVVSVQADEGRGSRGGGDGNGDAAAAPSACERSGHTVAVKVSLTNLQEKRLVVSRMEVVPPSASSSSSSTTTTAAANPASATTTTAAAAAAAAPAAASDGDAEGTVTWATLPNGPVLYDDDAATAAAAAAAGGGSGDVAVALPGTGDTYTCCFAAKGEAERPAPLGKLRVTWRPDETGGGGDGPTTPPTTGGGEAAVGGVTEFPLPVLTARPPALSARLKAPPHARVGVEFSMSWEISNLTAVYSSMQLTAEDGGDFVWSGKRLCMLQVAPMETVSVVYRLVPIVPGHVLLPKVAVVPEREQINIIPDLAEGRPHIFVRP